MNTRIIRGLHDRELLALVADRPLAVHEGRMLAQLRFWQADGWSETPNRKVGDGSATPVKISGGVVTGFGRDTHPIAFYGTSTGTERPPYAVAYNSIAIIDISGPLVNRADYWACMTSYEELRVQLKHANDSASIKGIVLRFDTPGGETAGAFDLAAELAAIAKNKPVWASVDDHCYSAGFLLASQCSKVFVTKTGGVGSVGVIAWHVDQSGWDEQIGIKVTTVYAGDRKNDFNPHEKLSEEAQSRLQESVNRLYGMFIGAVAAGRKMPEKAVRETKADTFEGQLAIDARFADAFGTFEEVVKGLALEVGAIQSTAGPTSMAAQPAEKGDEMPNLTTTAAAALPEEEDPTKVVPEDETEEAKEKDKKMEPTQVPVAAAPYVASMEEIVNMCSAAELPSSAVKEIADKKMTVAEVSAEVIKRMKDAQAPATTSRTSRVNGGALQAVEAAARQAGPIGSAAYAKAYADAVTPSTYAEYLAVNPAQRRGDIAPAA